MLKPHLLLPSIMLALALVPAPAQAGDGPTCTVPNPRTGQCTIVILPPPPPPPESGTKPIGATPGGGTAPKCTRYPSIAVPCSDPAFGLWSESYEVYCKVTAPQPPMTDPLWKGRTADKGAIYDCTSPYAGNFPSGQLWMPRAPAITISPEEAAEAVVRRMDLRAADIGIVP